MFCYLLSILNIICLRCIKITYYTLRSNMKTWKGSLNLCPLKMKSCHPVTLDIYQLRFMIVGLSWPQKFWTWISGIFSFIYTKNLPNGLCGRLYCFVHFEICNTIQNWLNLTRTANQINEGWTFLVTKAKLEHCTLFLYRTVIAQVRTKFSGFFPEWCREVTKILTFKADLAFCGQNLYIRVGHFDNVTGH